ncbi:MAG TPA: SAM-dependent methyltransferase [Crocinitomix sp.]|nr:SAM-dependent methyltransferase [Crocinitomix sp.]
MSRTLAKQWEDYELIDAGNEKKLERWGNVITIRPDRNAYFKSKLSQKDWYNQAHFEFIEHTHHKGEWQNLKNAPLSWEISYNDIIFHLKLTQFKHIGLFPEQQANWEFIAKHIQPQQKFLNLFAYTGASSLIAKSKGANTFHCDSVKQVINWSKKNMELSNLKDIHWVLEDALKFAQREVKRGRTYDGIIMDPPAFGLGAKKERWKIESLFPKLVKTASKLLTSKGFLIINTYSPRLKSKDIEPILNQYFPYKKIEISKLCIKSSTGKTIEYGELSRVY